MLRQPPARRPGLTHGTEPRRGPPSVTRRKWVRETGSPATVHTRGGPADLLTPATAGARTMPQVGYAGPDWYTDAPRRPPSTDLSRKSSSLALARAVPDWYTDEPMKALPLARPAPGGHTEVPRKASSLASVVPDWQTDHEAMKATPLAGAAADGHTGVPRKVPSLESVVPDWQTDVPKRNSCLARVVPDWYTDEPMKALPLARAAPDGHTEVPRKGSSLASATPDWYTDAPKRPSSPASYGEPDWQTDVPWKASSITSAVARKTAQASAVPDWHTEVPRKSISLASAVPNGHTDAPRKTSSLARAVPDWYTEVPRKTSPTPVSYEVPDWYSDAPRKPTPGARAVPGKRASAPRKASSATFDLPDWYTDRPILTPASGATPTAPNSPDCAMHVSDNKAEGARERYERPMGPFDFDVKSIWQRETDDEKENQGANQGSKAQLAEKPPTATPLPESGLPLNSSTTGKERRQGKKTVFSLEATSRRGDAVDFGKLLSHGYREDWFLQRGDSTHKAK